MRISFICGVAICSAVVAGFPAAAETYYVGEVTSNGGTVSGISGRSVSVVYDITKMTYIDSYYNNDEFGGATTVKNVVNGIGHLGASVTRTLVGFSTIDSLCGYSMSSAVLSLACTQNNDANWSVRAYAMAQSWTEGTGVSGGQTRWGLTVNGVTWSTTDGTTIWSNTSGTRTAFGGMLVGGGGSCDTSAYANAASMPVSGEWTTIDITNHWNKASIYGLVLMDYCISTGVTEDTSAIDPGGHVTERFATDDWVIGASDVFSYIDASPYLTVTYSVVPEPGTIMMVAIAAIGFCEFRRRKGRCVPS